MWRKYEFFKEFLRICCSLVFLIRGELNVMYSGCFRVGLIVFRSYSVKRDVIDFFNVVLVMIICFFDLSKLSNCKNYIFL